MQAEVAVNRGGKSGGVFSYKVPVGATDPLGKRVLVPLGRKMVTGFVIRTGDETRADLKEIAEISGRTYFTAELLKTADMTSERYLCPLYQVLEYMLPKLARDKANEIYTYCGSEEELLLLDEESAKVARAIKNEGQSLNELKRKFPQAEEILALLRKRGLVKVGIKSRESEREGEYLYEALISREELSSEDVQKKLSRAPKQEEMLRFLVLNGADIGRNLRVFWANYRALANALVAKGLVRRTALSKTEANFKESVFNNDAKFILNEEQERAFLTIRAKIEAREHEVFLLHGVTGSGKTEVYLRLIKETLARGLSVIFMVSEIALTPQLIGRLNSSLEERIEVLHSALNDTERYLAWQRLADGESRIVLGVRSAVFAPVKNLGLVILDEEHENTYKQSEPPPRYHAREVAIFRARMNNAAVVLGSATPSVASYYKAQTGEYQLLELKKRAQAQPLPAVEIVDLAEEFRHGNRSMFSEKLKTVINEALAKKEQIILFLNRRGYASFVLCRECGTVVTCPKCSLPMTYHKDRDVLKCHYCEQIMPAPKRCPVCGSGFIRYFGSGTELVESELRKIWPEIKTLRLDLDTTYKADSHHQILARFARGEADVLVGTQMVAKGLDFPDVTVVGVLAADQILNLPDYQAPERTFALLTQVAGRAGRGGKPGKVVIQTYNPAHYAITAAAKQDYQYFYQAEIKSRKLLEYPPFVKTARLLLSDFDEKSARESAKTAWEYLHEHYPILEITNAMPAPIERIRERWRYHIILKNKDLTVLLEAMSALREMLSTSRKSKTLRIIIDIEPENIL